GRQDHDLVRIPVEQTPAAADARQVLGLDDAPDGRDIRKLVVDVLSAPRDGTGASRRRDDQSDDRQRHDELRPHTDPSLYVIGPRRRPYQRDRAQGGWWGGALPGPPGPVGPAAAAQAGPRAAGAGLRVVAAGGVPGDRSPHRTAGGSARPPPP